MSVENLSPAAYRIFIKTLLRKQALSLSECTFSITRTFPRFKLHLGASCPNSACFISPHVAFSRIFAILSTRKNIPFSFVTSPAPASIFFQSFHQPASPFMPRSYRLPIFYINSYNNVYHSSTFLHKSHAKSLIQPRREPRPGTPLRGSTDTSRLSEGGPGAGAPHGILAGPRQPLVPFPCGKGTRTSADVRNSLKPHHKPPPVCRLHPKQKKNDLPSLDRSSQSYNPLATPQPLTAFSCSCTYSVVRIFFTVPSTSSSVVLWLV